MAVNLGNVTAVTIPEGRVSKILQGETILWSKIKIVTYTFTVKAENNEGYTEKTFTIRIQQMR